MGLTPKIGELSKRIWREIIQKCFGMICVSYVWEVNYAFDWQIDFTGNA